jgi:hypothetical protein
MEGTLAEMRCIIRYYMRMPNIKRVMVMELGLLITPTPGKSDYLQNEGICTRDTASLQLALNP